MALKDPRATFAQQDYNIERAIDGNPGTGWAVMPQMSRDHHAVFFTASPVGFDGGTTLAVSMEQNFGQQHVLGKFRLSVATDPKAADAPPVPDAIRAIVLTKVDARTPAQRAKVAEYYRSIDPEIAADRPPRPARDVVAPIAEAARLEKAIKAGALNVAAAQAAWETDAARRRRVAAAGGRDGRIGRGHRAIDRGGRVGRRVGTSAAEGDVHPHGDVAPQGDHRPADRGAARRPPPRQRAGPGSNGNFVLTGLRATIALTGATHVADTAEAADTAGKAAAGSPRSATAPAKIAAKPDKDASKEEATKAEEESSSVPQPAAAPNEPAHARNETHSVHATARARQAPDAEKGAAGEPKAAGADEESVAARKSSDDPEQTDKVQNRPGGTHRANDEAAPPAQEKKPHADAGTPPAKSSENAAPVAFASARAMFEQKDFGVAGALDDHDDTGWAIEPLVGRPVAATFALKSPIGGIGGGAGSGGDVLTVTLGQRSKYAGYALGRFRLYATTSPAPHDAPLLPANVVAALRTPADKRSDAQKGQLAKHYRTIAPQLDLLRLRLAELRPAAPKFPIVTARRTTVTIPVLVDRAKFDGDVVVTLEGFQSGREGNGPANVGRSLSSAPLALSAGTSLGVLRVDVTPDAQVGTKMAVLRAEGKVKDETVVQYGPAFPITVNER